jgi:putative ABC transport system substrate-binding protein
VIVAPGNVTAALVAKAATTTIPIVFSTGGDPVALGLVASLNRPDGNVTGASYLNAELYGKRMGPLRELLPGVDLVGVLASPNGAPQKRRCATWSRRRASLGCEPVSGG